MATTTTLGGLKLAPKKKAAQEKPRLPDPDGRLTQAVNMAIVAKKNYEAAKLVLDSNAAILKQAAFGHACEIYNGRTADEHTFEVGTTEGKAVISLKNMYRAPDDLTEVNAILGARAEELLHTRQVIQVDADQIPALMLEAFVEELVRLARKVDEINGTEPGKDGPVFNAISVTQKTVVDSSFHEKRHMLLSKDDNLRLHKVLPCDVAVSLKY